MKITVLTLMMLGVAGGDPPAPADGAGNDTIRVRERQEAAKNTDADELYDMVKQARAALREMRLRAGLAAFAAGPRAGPPARRGDDEGRGEHGGRGAGSERGEHGNRARGEGGEEGGEEGGAYLGKMTKQDELFANGARLVLQFNPNTEVFAGSVTNTTARILSQVRVEVHLDNGTELGPTKRIDVAPGQAVPVELGTFGNRFRSWVSHPEAGVEPGHGASGEERGEGRGEHGGEARGEGARPRDPAYRPVYNQLRILRGEMRAFEAELEARSR